MKNTGTNYKVELAQPNKPWWNKDISDYVNLFGLQDRFYEKNEYLYNPIAELNRLISKVESETLERAAEIARSNKVDVPSDKVLALNYLSIIQNRPTPERIEESALLLGDRCYNEACEDIASAIINSKLK